MAKKRSKKDRLRTQLHRNIKKAKTNVSIKKEVESEKVQKEKNYLEEIFAYDPKLIIKDLKKTFLVVLFVLLVLLTISLLYT